MRRSRSTAVAVRHCAPTFAALGDTTRLQLVAQLCKAGPLSITQLAADSHVSRQAVTKHLRVLADAGLVAGEREGREVLWTIEPNALARARDHLETIATSWDSTLARLKRLVEE